MELNEWIGVAVGIVTLITGGFTLMLYILKGMFQTKEKCEDIHESCQNEVCGQVDRVVAKVDDLIENNQKEKEQHAREVRKTAVALTAIASKLDIQVDVP